MPNRFSDTAALYPGSEYQPHAEVAVLQFGEPKVSPAPYLFGGEALLVWRCLEEIEGGEGGGREKGDGDVLGETR